MLPFAQKIAFLLFAAVMLSLAARGFYRLYRKITAGQGDPEMRFDRLGRRLWYALSTTLLQSRTFRKRPMISFFHSFIFYGFVFYIIVNLLDGIEGFVPFSIRSTTFAGSAYNLVADLLSAAVLVGVIALVLRRFLLPERRDFRFNERTLLHPDVRRQYISRDSIIVSAFILFHVGSRAVGAASRVAMEGPDRYQPFATLLSHAIDPAHAEAWRIFGYWGALGSVLAFLPYFPISKHIHIFMAPAKYLTAREESSGVLPAVNLNVLTQETTEEPRLGAKTLNDLAWPRLLDAYACIQCNRCQDVCPASATGKALSPAALEINKRMELNDIEKSEPVGRGESARPLLGFALSLEAAWACTTCGACMEVCPVQDEQMLDIIDIRRHQVMIEGEFPTQLQTSFRGMERAKNPWGINHDQRMAWADGLNVRTIEENPDPEVLYWVGCAASYDPESQKTARALVQLLTRAGVNFAVLGKQECCTGDSARRAGNEYLYRQLADQNVATLNRVRPKKIIASCPHCMNAIGKEYRQIGGEYEVLHHTEYLESLVAEGRLSVTAAESRVTYHDPCYLGRHNGVYDAPRNLLRVLTEDFVEMPRKQENAFCCGAGGAQFWKEEEPGDERVSQNRFREAQQTLSPGKERKILAVGCPFCKSMLNSSPGRDETIVVKDVAELLLEGLPKTCGASRFEGAPAVVFRQTNETAHVAINETLPVSAAPVVAAAAEPVVEQPAVAQTPTVERKKWAPKKTTPPNNPE
jgi:Fe-S oxidoreductase